MPFYASQSCYNSNRVYIYIGSSYLDHDHSSTEVPTNYSISLLAYSRRPYQGIPSPNYHHYSCYSHPTTKASLDLTQISSLSLGTHTERTWLLQGSGIALPISIGTLPQATLHKGCWDSIKAVWHQANVDRSFEEDAQPESWIYREICHWALGSQALWSSSQLSWS